MKNLTSDGRKEGMRMKELTEATGLPKSTILHYIAQGLLPEPTRTGRNTATLRPGVRRAGQVYQVYPEHVLFSPR